MKVDIVEDRNTKKYNIEFYEKFSKLSDVYNLSGDISDSLLRKINDERIMDLLNYISEHKDSLCIVNYLSTYFSEEVFLKLGVMCLVFSPAWRESDFQNCEVCNNIIQEYPMFYDESSYKLANYLLHKLNPFQIQLKGAMIVVNALYQLFEK